jgi:hypothetical protein
MAAVMGSGMKSASLVAVALAATLEFSTSADAQTSTPRRGKTVQSRRAAHNERTLGLMIGVHTIAAPGITLSSKLFDPGYRTNFGLGAGLMLGYGFNRTFSSYVSFDVAKQGSNQAVEGTFGLGHFEIGVRANFPNVSLGSSNTLPYLLGSFGRRALGARVYDEENDESFDIAFRGAVFGLGGGIEHFVSQHMSFDAGVHFGFGTFDHFTVDRETTDFGASGTTSVRLRLGVTWRP